MYKTPINLIKRYIPLLAGLLLVLSFAPFHLPGVAFVSLALLFWQLEKTQNLNSIFSKGLSFGIGFFGFGISWVYISIRAYGNLNIAISMIFTLLFIIYLSLYTGLTAIIYKKISKNLSFIYKPLIFAASWCLNEFLRATFLSGFPWLILGVSQIDTPLTYLLPVFGVYIGSFLVCFSSACLYFTFKAPKNYRIIWLTLFILPVILSGIVKYKKWTVEQGKSLPVAVIQANVSVQDKWDISQFQKILNNYADKINQVISKNKIIVLPEAAISLPSYYIQDFIDKLDKKAQSYNSAILLGIPEPANDGVYYNSIISLGNAKGRYLKQHLVPFGEFIPKPFTFIIEKLQIPIDNLMAGPSNQQLIKVHDDYISSLICYEIAYPELVRKQLSSSKWIFTASDDGWFGQSLAIYQHLQLAQVLSLLSGRYQIMANNDGLSAVIDNNGKIINKLDAFKDGILESHIYNAIGATPWSIWGDMPILIFCLFFCIIAIIIGYIKNTEKYTTENLLNNK